MTRKYTEICNGWVITFEPHAHMYFHHLAATKDGNTYHIPCEDSVNGGDGIIIWSHALDLDAELLRDLNDALLEWLRNKDFIYEFYPAPNDCKTNAYGV